MLSAAARNFAIQRVRVCVPAVRGVATARPAHTTESYEKEVDQTPAVDPKVYRVDPSSDTVQKPYEPPSGPFSKTGVEAGVKGAHPTEGTASKNGAKKNPA